MLPWVRPRRICISIIYFHNDIDNIIKATQVHSFYEEGLQTICDLTAWSNDTNVNTCFCFWERKIFSTQMILSKSISTEGWGSVQMLQVIFTTCQPLSHESIDGSLVVICPDGLLSGTFLVQISAFSSSFRCQFLTDWLLTVKGVMAGFTMSSILPSRN